MRRLIYLALLPVGLALALAWTIVTAIFDIIDLLEARSNLDQLPSYVSGLFGMSWWSPPIFWLLPIAGLYWLAWPVIRDGAKAAPLKEAPTTETTTSTPQVNVVRLGRTMIDKSKGIRRANDDHNRDRGTQTLSEILRESRPLLAACRQLKIPTIDVDVALPIATKAAMLAAYFEAIQDMLANGFVEDARKDAKDISDSIGEWQSKALAERATSRQ